MRRALFSVALRPAPVELVEACRRCLLQTHKRKSRFCEFRALIQDFEMEQVPDFLLSSADEYKLLSEPRACWTKCRLRDPVRDDYMLIEIDPVLTGQPFGFGDQNISRLVLSTRHEG